MVTMSKLGISKQIDKLNLHASSSHLAIEPTCYSQVNKDPKWLQVMADQFNALLQNHTWALVPHESTMNVVGRTWKYWIKYRDDGFTERYKGRLVAQGFH